jgi:hypothetical protein
MDAKDGFLIEIAHRSPIRLGYLRTTSRQGRAYISLLIPWNNICPRQ